MTDKPKRGLAAMSPEKRLRIQQMGGAASPTNFKKRRDLASKAGRISRKPKPDTEELNYV